MQTTNTHARFSARLRRAAMRGGLALAIAIALGLPAVVAVSWSDNKADTADTNRPPTPPPADTAAPKLTVVKEDGDAGEDCEHCQKITAAVPFTITGSIGKEGDKDCYCFDGKKDKTYVIGVTGDKRKLEIDGQQQIDGLGVYSPPKDGPVCICVSGGTGEYSISVHIF